MSELNDNAQQLVQNLAAQNGFSEAALNRGLSGPAPFNHPNDALPWASTAPTNYEGQSFDRLENLTHSRNRRLVTTADFAAMLLARL